MSIDQIEQEIERLSATERNELEARLLARRYGLHALDQQEQAELLASLDEADREIDEGRSYTADQLRQAIPGWRGK